MVRLIRLVILKIIKLTSKDYKKANPNAILMHPGPVNQGIEITEAVYKSKQSVILDQVANGVAMRMAIVTKYLSQ